MTIRHLKIFIAVAETGSMSGAAQKLYLSQPTVSQAIQELERHYQIHLFERLSRKLFITGEGRQLLSLATQAVSQFDSLEATMQERRRVSSLRLGSSITVGTCLIPSVIQELEQQFPDIQIFSVASNTREIEQKLLLSQLDAAVVEGNIESPDLVCIPVIHDRLVLCCAASHEFYHRDVICSSQLEGQKFAMREPGSGTRRLFEQYLHARGIRVRITWEANCPRTLLNAVLANNVLTVMSSRLMGHDIARGRLRIFLDEAGDWDRDFKLVYHKNKLLTPEINALRNILEQYRPLNLPEGKSAGHLRDD